MNKIFSLTVLGTSILVGATYASSARAQVQINLTAGQLLQSDGLTPVNNGGLLLLVASTTDAVFTAPTTTSFNPGSDDQVVARFALDSTTVGTPGNTNQQISFTYSGNFSVGDPLSLFWYPTLTTSAMAPGGNASYGMFRTDQVQSADGSDIAWTAPANGGPYSLYFLTASQGGSNPDAFGVASFTTPIPEPSTYALLGLGLGGLALGAIRRRQRQVAA